MKYKSIKFFLFFLICFNYENLFANLDASKLDQLKNSTVYITVESGESFQSGSGFVVNKTDNKGLIVTNAHVVDLNINHQKINVYFNSGTQKENKLSAKIIALNQADDLALLEVESETISEVINLGKNTDVIETQELYMIGFPFGAKFSTNRDNPTVTISKGIISSKKLDTNDQILLIQIDGDINPGNSGGPIVNSNGELVGVSVATVRKTNIGFAIPKLKVANMLEGSIGNIQVKGEGNKFELVAEKFDPYNKISSASLSVHENNEKVFVSSYLDKNQKWKKAEDQVLNINLNINENNINGIIEELPDNEKEYLAQIKITRGKNSSYQAPFRIKRNKLSLSFYGPNVLKEDDNNLLSESDSKLETEQGKKDKKTTDKAISSILINSGLDAFIKSMTEEPEDLFDDVEEEENKEKKEFVLSFIEIFRTNWHEENIKTHYIKSFKENIKLNDIKKLDNLFSDPAFRETHVNINDFSEINTYELNKFANDYKRNTNITDEKLKVIEDIKNILKIEYFLMTSFEATNRSVMLVMNDIAPKSMKKDEKFINDDIQKLTGPYKRYWGNIVYYYMIKKYVETDIADLEDYLKLIKTDAFNTFIQEKRKTLEVLLSNHMLTVEEDVKKLMDERHKTALGIDMLPSLEGKNSNEIISILIDTHGKDEVIKMLIQKTGGEVTTENNGRLKTSFGRPRKDLVTNRSILYDLKNIKLSASDFAEQVESKLVEKRHQELSTKRWQYAPSYSR